MMFQRCNPRFIRLGLEPIIVENLLEGDELTTNVEEISKRIEEVGAENVLCVMTTTSCFAPRIPDRLVWHTLAKQANIID